MVRVGVLAGLGEFDLLLAARKVPKGLRRMHALEFALLGKVEQPLELDQIILAHRLEDEITRLDDGLNVHVHARRLAQEVDLEGPHLPRKLGRGHDVVPGAITGWKGLEDKDRRLGIVLSLGDDFVVWCDLLGEAARGVLYDVQPKVVKILDV